MTRKNMGREPHEKTKQKKLLQSRLVSKFIIQVPDCFSISADIFLVSCSGHTVSGCPQPVGEAGHAAGAGCRIKLGAESLPLPAPKKNNGQNTSI